MTRTNIVLIGIIIALLIINYALLSEQSRFSTARGDFLYGFENQSNRAELFKHLANYYKTNHYDTNRYR